jgi:muramidase (phage lysozyme)
MADRKFYEQFRQTPEAQALLRMLRFAEGTERGGADSYRVMFGGSLAPNLQQHPDKVMRGRSTAAGAYQFLTPTWKQQQQKLNLGSFGPLEQDIAALDLARQRTLGLGGLSYLQKKGLTPEFVAALAPEWASLPTLAGRSAYGQPVKSFSSLEETYKKGLKPLAGSAPATESPSSNEISSADFLKEFTNALLGVEEKQPTITEMIQQRLLKDLLAPQPTGLEFLSGLI